MKITQVNNAEFPKWLNQLKIKYPPDCHEDTAGLVRVETDFREQFMREGIMVVFDFMYERFKYNAEQWLKMTHLDDTGYFPYFRYVCTCLPHSRKSHKEKHNIDLPKDHPFWLTWWPPNGMGCFCLVTAVPNSISKRKATSPLTISTSSSRRRILVSILMSANCLETMTSLGPQLLGDFAYRSAHYEETFTVSPQNT